MTFKKNGKIAFQCDKCNTTTTEFVDGVEELERLAVGWETIRIKGGYYINRCPDCIAGKPFLSRGVVTNQQAKVEKAFKARLSGISRESLNELQKELKEASEGIKHADCMEVVGLHYNTIQNFINDMTVPTKDTVKTVREFLKEDNKGDESSLYE